MLSPQGHVEHHFVVTELGGTDLPGHRAGRRRPALLGYLDGMRFWSEGRARRVTDELALLTLVGPTAAATFRVALASEIAVACSNDRATPCRGGGFVRPIGGPRPGCCPAPLGRDRSAG